MATEETIKTLIQTAKEFRDQVDIALIHNGSVTGLWLRTAEALEQVVSEMHARELHHFEEEAISSEYRNALVRVRDEARSTPGPIFEIANAALEGS